MLILISLSIETGISEFIRLATVFRETCSQKSDLKYRISQN
jgi:hypothetical protein